MKKKKGMKMKIDPESISWIVFDIDGVLVDVSESYFQAFHQLVQMYCKRFEIPYNEKQVKELIVFIKQFPQMNDDWDAGEAINVLYLNKHFHWFDEKTLFRYLNEMIPWSNIRNQLQETLSLDFDLMRNELQSIYGGEQCEAFYGFSAIIHGFKGTYKNEKPFIEGEVLNNLSVHKLIYTGRNHAELLNALSLLKISPNIFSLILDADTGFFKPDPTPLLQWYQKYIGEGEIGLYFGDSGADVKTVEKFNKQIGDNNLILVIIGDTIPNYSLQFPSVKEALDSILG